MIVRVHIERLIVDAPGIARGDRALIDETVRTELMRLFSEGGAAAVTTGSAQARVTTSLPPSTDASAIGLATGAAQALHTAVTDHAP